MMSPKTIVERNKGQTKGRVPCSLLLQTGLAGFEGVKNQVVNGDVHHHSIILITFFTKYMTIVGTIL